jgi:hypothetical protein
MLGRNFYIYGIISLLLISGAIGTFYYQQYLHCPYGCYSNLPNGYYIYTVKPNDSISTIQRSVGVPWPFIADVNGIPASNIIHTNQQLLIPYTQPGCSSNFTSPGNYSSHTSTSKRYVIIRFDGSFQDQWVNALPILLKYGFHAVFATASGNLLNVTLCGPSLRYEDMNWPEVEWLYQNGNQISDQTMTFAQLNHQNSTGLQYQLDESKIFLNQHGIVGINSLTMPDGQGCCNQTVLNAARQYGYQYVLPSGRNSFTGIIDIYPSNSTTHIQWYSIDASNNESLGVFVSFVSKASSTTVIGLVYYHVANNIPDTNYVNTTNFQQQMSYLYKNNYNVILPTQNPGT